MGYPWRERPRQLIWPVREVLRRATTGELQLYAPQGLEPWEGGRILRLFDSLCRGYPVGGLVVWETRTPVGHSAFGPLRFDPSPGPRHLVVDGRQRVAAIVATCLGGGHMAGAGNGGYAIYIDLVGRELRRLEAGATPPDTWLPVDSALGGVELIKWQRSRLVPLERSLEDVACTMGGHIRDYELPVTVLRLEDESCVGEVVGRVNGGRVSQEPASA